MGVRLQWEKEREGGRRRSDWCSRSEGATSGQVTRTRDEGRGTDAGGTGRKEEGEQRLHLRGRRATRVARLHTRSSLLRSSLPLSLVACRRSARVSPTGNHRLSLSLPFDLSHCLPHPCCPPPLLLPPDPERDSRGREGACSTPRAYLRVTALAGLRRDGRPSGVKDRRSGGASTERELQAHVGSRREGDESPADEFVVRITLLRRS